MTVWDPHIFKQKHSLEMVQRRAARWVTNRYHNTSSVSDMLHTLGWRSLEHRRATSRLCMLFQIYLVVLLASHMILISSHTHILHDPHVKQICIPSQHSSVRTNYFKCSFFLQTIVAWNTLPKSVVTSSTLDAFKVSLGRPIPS